MKLIQTCTTNPVLFTTQAFKEILRQTGYDAIDRVVDSLPDKIEGQDLEEASMITRDAIKEVGAALFEKVLMHLGAEEQAAKSTTCPECNATLKSPKNTRRTIDTQFGRISLPRAYFYCRKCHRGVCPFDKKVGFAATMKQFDLQRPAGRLLAEMPFEKASELFYHLTGNRMSDHAMHELGERMGEASDKVHVLPTRHRVTEIIDQYSRSTGWRPILVVSADGAQTPMRPEAGRADKRGPGYWKEAKGFRIYLLVKDRIEQIMSWHQISGEEEFGEALSYAATLIPQEKVRIATVGDGASWVWKHLEKAFPQSRPVLDYYHCSQHIHKFAELQCPKDGPRQSVWIESTMARLNEGEVHSVIHGLERMNPASELAGDEARRLVQYLRTHADRIDYKSAHRGGYPRGSGGIESANKFICHVRLKRSGAFWYEINGNSMLRLRCSMYNGTFDEVFSRYKKLSTSHNESG